MRKPRLEEEKERVAKQSATPMAELYPKSRYRLAHLIDGDEQLHQLIELFASVGMPTGSDYWPRYCESFVRRLLDEQRVLWRIRAQHADGQEVDWARVDADMEQARKMHIKRKPKVGAECAFCGHRDAQTFKKGWAICDPCKEARPNWEKELT